MLEKRDAINHLVKVVKGNLKGLNKKFLSAAQAWNLESSAVLYTILSVLEPGIIITGSDADELCFHGVSANGEAITVKLYPSQDPVNDYPLISIAKKGQTKTYECEYKPGSKSFHFGLFAASFSLNGADIYRECQNTRYVVSIKKGEYILDVNISKDFGSCLLRDENKSFLRTLFDEDNLLEALTKLEPPFKTGKVDEIIYNYFAGLDLLFPSTASELLKEVKITVSRAKNNGPATLVRSVTARNGRMVECTSVVGEEEKRNDGILKPVDRRDNTDSFILAQAASFMGLGVNFSQSIKPHFLAILYKLLKSIENMADNIFAINSNYNKMSFACYNLEGERLEVLLEPSQEMMFVTIKKANLVKKYRCNYDVKNVEAPTDFSFTLIEAKFNIADREISIQPKTTSLTITLADKANGLASFFQVEMRPNSVEAVAKRSTGNDHFWPIDEIELFALLTDEADSPISIIELYQALLNKIDVTSTHLSISSLSKLEDGTERLEEVTLKNGQICLNGEVVGGAPSTGEGRKLVL